MLLAGPVAVGAAARTPIASAPVTTAQLQADNARLATENARLKRELDTLAAFVPREKAWWERSIVESLLVGLFLGFVGYYYTNRQARAALTMDLVKLWLDVWSKAYAEGIVPLTNHGLAIGQDALNAIERLGSLYEIIATAVLAGKVDRAALERYGMRQVNREFRKLLDDNAKKIPATAQETDARDALHIDLARWTSGERWA